MDTSSKYEQQTADALAAERSKHIVGWLHRHLAGSSLVGFWKFGKQFNYLEWEGWTIRVDSFMETRLPLLKPVLIMESEGQRYVKPIENEHHALRSVKKIAADLLYRRQYRA